MLTKMKTKANAIQSDIYKMALLSSKIEDIDGGTCHMIKRVGRKSKLTEEEVRKVILMFRENVQAMGNISFQRFTVMRMNFMNKESYQLLPLMHFGEKKVVSVELK